MRPGESTGDSAETAFICSHVAEPLIQSFMLFKKVSTGSVRVKKQNTPKTDSSKKKKKSLPSVRSYSLIV